MHLVQCVFFILPTWLMWYYKGDGEEVGEGGRHRPISNIDPYEGRENLPVLNTGRFS